MYITYTYRHTYTCTYTCIHLHTYAYIYMHTHTHIHTCTYINIHRMGLATCIMPGVCATISALSAFRNVACSRVGLQAYRNPEP